MFLNVLISFVYVFDKVKFVALFVVIAVFRNAIVSRLEIDEFMDKTEERYYNDESADSDDERNFNLLTRPSKKIYTEDIEEIVLKKSERKDPDETNLASLIPKKHIMPHSTRSQITDIINKMKEIEDPEFMNRLRHVLFLTEYHNISLDERNEINKLLVEKQLHPMRTVIKKKISIHYIFVFLITLISIMIYYIYF